MSQSTHFQHLKTTLGLKIINIIKLTYDIRRGAAGQVSGTVRSAHVSEQSEVSTNWDSPMQVAQSEYNNYI